MNSHFHHFPAIVFRLFLVLFVSFTPLCISDAICFSNNYRPENSLSEGIEDSIPSPVEFISCYFENASPLYWEYNSDGSVNIHFPYDHERSSPNRQFTHIHFQVQAKPGSDVTLILHYFQNIWNGRLSSASAPARSLYISPDGINWTAVPAQPLENNAHKLQIHMESGSLYVTGVEPYRLSDLNRFLAEIKDNRLIEIQPIGLTVEGHLLEMIRVGNAQAPHSVVLRARAHPWESAGNWVVEGLIRSLLETNEKNAEYLKRYCVYIMPMANKDGVERGMTRFNTMGMDLNRKWDLPADPELNPENRALENWIEEMINKGKKPDLLIDLHNDSNGKLLVSRPNVNYESYLKNMEKLETLLLKHTWFTEGSSHSFSYGSIGSGLVERYGIDACTYELNQLWIEGLKKVPFGADWVLLGKQLRDVFYNYFETVEPLSQIVETKGKLKRLTRDLNVTLLTNQIGYVPDACKSVIGPGNIERNFDIIDLETQQIVFTGKMVPGKCDFGEYAVGDFSMLEKEGYYFIRSDTLRSYPFRISGLVYKEAMEMSIRYFSVQRCGPSTTGYLAPCHMDDGKRMDNGKHQDVTGGWHDASDLRKWVEATIYGMIGLAKAYELQAIENSDKILEELMWGNDYFLKMQEPQGYVMDHVGGDVMRGSDSNRWTDNEISPEGGELRMVKPASGRSNRDMFIFGESDDRVIQTDPANMLTQYNFIFSQAMMSRITEIEDPAYSRRCLMAAEKCFEWCVGAEEDLNPRYTGAAIQAGIEMYKTTSKDIYKVFAFKQAKRLAEMQALKEGNNPSGFFYSSASSKEPYKNIFKGCLEFISICDLIQTFPYHKDVPQWKNMITSYAYNYLAFMSDKNSFGIVPYGLYNERDPGGNRKIGDYWYRYFMEPELEWWTGINANLASAGVGLVKAADILNDKKLKALAQKQFDWIIGVNPFNSSTMIGSGHNHPKQYMVNAFYPGTPVIPGAVMNGLGGDHLDQPDIGNGNYHISEYWTPMVVFTLWLMAELSK